MYFFGFLYVLGCDTSMYMTESVIVNKVLLWKFASDITSEILIWYEENILLWKCCYNFQSIG